MQDYHSTLCVACPKQATRLCAHPSCTNISFLCDGQCDDSQISAIKTFHTHQDKTNIISITDLKDQIDYIRQIIARYYNIKEYLQQTVEKLVPPLKKENISYLNMSPKPSQKVWLFILAFEENQRQKLTGHGVYLIMNSKNYYYNWFLNEELVEIGLEKMTNIVQKISDSMPEFLDNFCKHAEINDLRKLDQSKGTLKQLEIIKSLELSYSLNPFQTQLLFSIGNKYFQLKKYEKCVEYIQYYLALGLHKQTDYMKCYKLLTQCSEHFSNIRLEPTGAQIFKKMKIKCQQELSRAKELIKSNASGNQIINALTNAFYLSVKFPKQALTIRAEVWSRYNCCAQALEDYVLLTTIEQSNPTAQVFYKRGQTELKLSKFDDALQSITRAIEQDIRPYYYSMRGYCYYGKGDYQTAFAEFILGIPDQQSKQPIKGLQINIDNNIPACNAALKFYNAVLEKFKLNNIAYFQRARVYLNLMTNIQNALKDLQQAIKINPNQHKYYSSKALAQQMLGMLHQSLATYQISIPMKAECYECYTSRAVVYYKLKDYENVLKDLNKSIGMGEKNEFAKPLRGKVLAKLGEYERAEKDYMEVFEADSKKLMEWEKAKMCKVMKMYKERLRKEKKEKEVKEEEGKILNGQNELDAVK